MEFRYRPEVLEQLRAHGVCPLPHTRPSIAFRFVGELYRHELRALKRLRAAGTVPARDYADRVIDLRRRYPLVSIPVNQWTVPGSPEDPEDVPLC